MIKTSFILYWLFTTNILSAQNNTVHVDSLNNPIFLDTIEIIYGDTLYYDDVTFHLICADGSPGMDQVQSVFKISNLDAFYIIHPGNGPKIYFEGRIKPGKKKHGKFTRFYSHSNQVRHLASETDYFNGIKNGCEVHYERNGSINWEKWWDMGKYTPALDD